MHILNKILLTINACVSVAALFYGYYGIAGFHSTVVATMLAIHFAAEAHKARKEKGQ
jgi:F0F1-type ATP synthase assembly protein I